jgi:hypothetical protein
VYICYKLIFDINMLIAYLTTMKWKIISFPGGNIEKYKQRPLSRLMIVMLIDACEKQKRGLLFDLNNIKVRFTAVIKRGLIIPKEISINATLESI